MTIPAFAVLGLLFGSFATVVAHRFPRGENIVTGRSRCPNCGHTITAVENIPLLSYLLQRGRCRNCGERISPRYPLVEAASAVLFALAAWKFGLTPEAFVYALFFWILLVLTEIDREHQLLPDRVVVPALAVGAVALVTVSLYRDRVGQFTWTVALGGAIAALIIILFVDIPALFRPRPRVEEADPPEPSQASRREALLFRFFGLIFLAAWLLLVVLALSDPGYDSLAGAVLGMGLFAGFFSVLPLVYLAGMGFGDVKLALLLGMMSGYVGGAGLTLVAMFLSLILGGVLGALIALAMGGSRKTKIPFGPWLALGTVGAVLFGETLLQAYLELGA